MAEHCLLEPIVYGSGGFQITEARAPLGFSTHPGGDENDGALAFTGRYRGASA